ncbi:MAG: hypothetical protein ACP5E4_01895 [Candidatus Aenigmatarchaeota archaeon]
MVSVEAGRICKKTAGREAGRYCVVLSIEGKFAKISGIRKYGMCSPRRCNLKHLVPTKFKVEVTSDRQEDVRKAVYASGIIPLMGLKKDRRARYTKSPIWEKKGAKAAKKEEKAVKPEKKAPKKEKEAPKAEAKKAAEKPAQKKVVETKPEKKYEKKTRMKKEAKKAVKAKK